MLTHNDAPKQDGAYEDDIEEISRRVAVKAKKWVPNWFPNGMINKRRDELRLDNIRGAPPRNEGCCVIYLKGDKAGCWYDFSEGTGGPPLSTLAEATGRRGADLLAYAAALAGVMPDWINDASTEAHDRIDAAMVKFLAVTAEARSHRPRLRAERLLTRSGRPENLSFYG